jgi:hypothetical protein
LREGRGRRQVEVGTTTIESEEEDAECVRQRKKMQIAIKEIMRV